MTSLLHHLHPTHPPLSMQALIHEALLALELQHRTPHLGCTAADIQEYILTTHHHITHCFEFERAMLTELGRGCVGGAWQALKPESGELTRYRALGDEGGRRVRVFRKPSEGRLRGKGGRERRERGGGGEFEEVVGKVMGLSLGPCAR